MMQDQLSLSSAQIGVLLSSFFWMYAPAQLLAGWLVQRFDIRYVLGAGVAVWALATGLTGLASGFASILALRLLLGLGESVTFPSWQLITARKTEEHERGRLNGLVGAGQGVGPMLGTLFGGLTMARFGWRAMFIGLGVITMLWLWPWFSATRGGDFYKPVKGGPRPVSYGAILRQRAFWGAALGHFGMNYAFYFVISWLPSFLVKAGGFTVSQMAGIGAAIYAVYAASTVVCGVGSDVWIRRGASVTKVRKSFVLVSAAGSAVAIALCGLVDPRNAVWFLGAAGVFFGMTTPMLFAIGATLAGPRAAGQWAGAQNLAGQLAGVVAPLVTGFIVQRTGVFSGAFAVAAGVSLLSMLAWGLVIQRVAPVVWRDEAAVAAGYAH
jgi:MFS family permease